MGFAALVFHGCNTKKNGNMKANNSVRSFNRIRFKHVVFFFLGGLQLHVGKEHPPCRSFLPEVNLKTGISRCVCVARFVVKSHVKKNHWM